MGPHLHAYLRAHHSNPTLGARHGDCCGHRAGTGQANSAVLHGWDLGFQQRGWYEGVQRQGREAVETVGMCHSFWDGR